MSSEPLTLEQRLLDLLHGFMEEHGLEPEEGAENWCAELDEAFVKRLAEFIRRETNQSGPPPPSGDTFALVTTAGDPSVGIPGAAVTIEGLPPGMDDTERRDTRDLLTDAFSDLFGEPAGVEFGDEIEAMLAAEAALDAEKEAP